MTRRRAAVLVGLTAVVAAVALPSVASSSPERLEIRIRYSRFEPGYITVPRGRPVAITLVNEDPIDHEWIVGTEEVHRAHRTGTETEHAARPTEVSLPALETRLTTVTFGESARLRFVCHLPGHEAYGMTGILEVR